MKRQIFESIYCNLLLMSVIKKLEYASLKKRATKAKNKKAFRDFQKQCKEDLNSLEDALSFLESKMGKDPNYRNKVQLKLELDPLFNIIEERIAGKPTDKTLQ